MFEVELESRSPRSARSHWLNGLSWECDPPRRTAEQLSLAESWLGGSLALPELNSAIQFAKSDATESGFVCIHGRTPHPGPAVCRAEGFLHFVKRLLPRFAALTALLALVLAASVCHAASTRISPKQLTQLLRDSSRAVHRGDYSLTAGKIAESSLVIVQGSLDVASGIVLKGEVWIINGDLILAGDSHVEGRVNIVDGGLYQSQGSSITGRIEHYHCSCKLDADEFNKSGRMAFRKTADPKSLDPRIEAGSESTNRVDYETVFLGLGRGNPDNPRPHWRGHAHLLIPLRENTRGFLGLDLELNIPISGRAVGLQIQGFKKTVTNDSWQYPVSENGAALLLSHSDFLDYYERSGGRAGMVIDPGHSLSFAGGIYLDHSQSLRTVSVSSLANNGRPLRDNPPVDRGEILGLDLSATYDTRDDPVRPASAWYLQTSVDAGFRAGPGDFGFTTLTLEACRYNRLWRKINLDLRARVFTGWRDLPAQRLQSLNGYGGVRGLHDIPFPDRRGDRMALASAELRIPLPQLPVFKILYTRWDLLVFADAGLLRMDGGAAAPFRFLNVPKSEWGKSIGIGVSGEAFLPYLGFYVAQDVTRLNKRPRFIVRAARSF